MNENEVKKKMLDSRIDKQKKIYGELLDLFLAQQKEIDIIDKQIEKEQAELIKAEESYKAKMTIANKRAVNDRKELISDLENVRVKLYERLGELMEANKKKSR
ncbi:hypothetical protein ACFJYA_11295 [Enterococcus faecalis]